MKISLLRAKRRLVSSTFGWLSIPMHAAITGLLIFIVHIISRFDKMLQSANAAQSSTSPVLEGVGSVGTFENADITLLNYLVIMVALIFIGANAFAVKAAGGGHGFKLFYNLSIFMVITGVILLVTPKVVDSIMEGVITIGD